jgi:hypothetical protein
MAALVMLNWWEISVYVKLGTYKIQGISINALSVLIYAKLARDWMKYVTLVKKMLI